MAKTASWDSFLDDLEPGKDPRTICHLLEFIESLDEKPKLLVQGAVENPKISTLKLTKALRDRGFTYRETPIKRHRSKTCACFRES